MEDITSCPICLSSSDEGAENIAFVITNCNHTFCVPCIERSLLQSTNARQHHGREEEEFHLEINPTLGRCPICRQSTSLFDLRHVAAYDDSAYVYPKNTNVSSRLITNSVDRHRPSGRTSNSEELLQNAIQERGIIGGFGITFQFQGDTPLLEFTRPLKISKDFESSVSGDNSRAVAETLDSVRFDSFHFFQKTTTFHGKRNGENS